MLTNRTASELAHLLASRELSAREVAEAFLERVRKHDSLLGCYLSVDEEKVLSAADAAQSMINRGEAGPLCGIPVAVKDNLCTKGQRTTCASRMLADYVPPYDATAVAKLGAAGAILLGKTNLDEFAMGASTETSAFQLTRNPWDVTRSPGGSSGGSAAAVAAGLAPLALGSDTGGSIRQPAALCGIVGFKPTYGRCSRYGLVAYGSSLDQVGPMAATVEDAALLAGVVTGQDPADSTSLPLPPISTKGLKDGSLRGLRIAVVRELFGEGVDQGVRQSVGAAIKTLELEGAVVTTVSLPTMKLGVTTYYIIAPAEASSNLARFDGVRFGARAEGKGHVGLMERTRTEGFGQEVKTRIMVGTYALSSGYYDAFYVRAQQVRAMMQEELLAVFQDHDLVLSPTSPVTAFKLGELIQDPLALKLLDQCTIPANLAGLPAISLNCGFVGGLPVGLQLMAAPAQDERLLQSAFAVERALPDTRRRPSLD